MERHRLDPAPPGCGYVLEAGGPRRFCDAPVAPRASYCPRHQALCRVAPESTAGRRLAAALARAAEGAPPPPGLACLDAVAILDPPEALMGDEIGLAGPRRPAPGAGDDGR